MGETKKQDRMARPYEQQTDTVPQPSSNQSAPDSNANVDQVSDVPNTPSPEPGDRLVFMLRSIQRTVDRWEESFSELELNGQQNYQNLVEHIGKTFHQFAGKVS
ncbi:hypothetical protein HOY80DRAFT_1025956 [Tuber brumale]|nr:hypothetical protein HOY80DRAFT_1025956 [Tuber brumale]